MPYEVVREGCSTARPYGVRKTGTTKSLGCHTTRAKANAQVRALYASEASLSEFNALIEHALEEIAPLEAALAAVYAEALHARGQSIAQRMERLSIQAAAFVPPDHAELNEPLSMREREALVAAQEEASDRLAAILLIPLGLGFLGATIRERIAFRAADTFDEQVILQIRAIVERGLRDGLTITDVAGAIQSAFEGSSGSSAEMLARTHITALTNETSLTAARSLESGRRIFKQWNTARDGRVRIAHARAEGQTKPLDAPFEIGGSSMMYPGDPAGPIALTANCRCILTYTRALPLTASGSTLPEGEPMVTALEDMLSLADNLSAYAKRAKLELAWSIAAEQLKTITADAGTGPAWRGNLVTQRSVTPDGRMIEADALGHRELPLPLMAMFENGPGGHEGARLAGRIDSITQDGDDFIGEGVIDAGGEAGAELIRLRTANIPLGISIDMAIQDKELRAKSDPFGPALEDEDALEAVVTGDGVLVITSATILGATVCPMQAIDEANSIEVLVSDADGAPAVVRAHAAFQFATPVVIETTGDPDDVKLVPNPRRESRWSSPRLIASGSHKRASIDAFRRPEPDHAHPIQYTDDGFMFGHLAPWDCCHVGWTVCTPPPASNCDYAYFHTGAYKTAEGEMVAVGKLVFSMDGGKHAPESMSAQEAAEYYDDYTKCAGYVVARDGEHGIWVSGIQRPGLTEEELDFLRLHPMSGDWRPIRGFGEAQLIGGFSVTIGGYPMPQTEMLLTASAGAPDRMRTLIITPGWVEDDVPESDLARMARVLAARAHGGVEGLAELAHSDE